MCVLITVHVGRQFAVPDVASVAVLMRRPPIRSVGIQRPLGSFSTKRTWELFSAPHSCFAAVSSFVFSWLCEKAIVRRVGLGNHAVWCPSCFCTNQKPCIPVTQKVSTSSRRGTQGRSSTKPRSEGASVQFHWHRETTSRWKSCVRTAECNSTKRA